jgi:hypothetical protein
MSSQSGSFDAATVSVELGVGTPQSPVVNLSSGSTTFATTTPTALVDLNGNGGTVGAGGTTLTFTSNSGFTNAAWQTVGNLVVFTPDWGAGTASNGVNFNGGTSTNPIALIGLPISSFNNSSSVTVTLPSAYPVGNLSMSGGSPLSRVNVFPAGTTPSITFTGTGFPVFPVGTLVTLTNVIGTNTFGNYNRIINRPVLTSTSTQLTISGWLFQNGTFTSATVNSPVSYATTIQYAGTGYTTGDTFIIRGTMLGGTSPLNDLTLTVTAGTVNGLPNAVSSLSVSGTAIPSVAQSFALEYPNNRVARDSSDITRMLKERTIYNEYRAGTNIADSVKSDRRGGIVFSNPGAANQRELLQSNQFRMSYLKGRMNCGACAGGYFNANGPLSFNSSGTRTGS